MVLTTDKMMPHGIFKVLQSRLLGKPIQNYLRKKCVVILKIEKNQFDLSLKYRSRTEIVAMILEAANGGATKTKIMYRAFLSYAQLREYLTVLIENGLLEYMEGAQMYKTTAKGLNFLKMHNEIGELLQTSPIASEKER
jgi:predicted transcriptional regulator